jgi:hypothetical protein
VLSECSIRFFQRGAGEFVLPLKAITPESNNSCILVDYLKNGALEQVGLFPFQCLPALSCAFLASDRWLVRCLAGAHQP